MKILLSTIVFFASLLSFAKDLDPVTGTYAGILYSNHKTHIKGALELRLEVRRRPDHMGGFEDYLHVVASLNTGKNHSEVDFTDAFYDPSTSTLGGEIHLAADVAGAIKFYGTIRNGIISGRLYNELAPEMGGSLDLEFGKHLGDIELPETDGFNITDWSQLDEVVFKGTFAPGKFEEAQIELRFLSEPISRVAHFFEAFMYSRNISIQVTFHREKYPSMGLSFNDAHWDYGQGVLKAILRGFGANSPTITLDCKHPRFKVKKLNCIYTSNMGMAPKRFDIELEEVEPNLTSVHENADALP